jgi:hypothetical protein
MTCSTTVFDETRDNREHKRKNDSNDIYNKIISIVGMSRLLHVGIDPSFLIICSWNTSVSSIPLQSYFVRMNPGVDSKRNTTKGCLTTVPLTWSMSAPSC